MSSTRMTRREVARRLGKSVATVRRLEGGLLRPTRDSRGVHWFDDNDVEALARDIENGDVTVWRELRDGGSEDDGAPILDSREDSSDRLDDLERENRKLRWQLADEQRKHASAIRELEERNKALTSSTSVTPESSSASSLASGCCRRAFYFDLRPERSQGP